MGALISFYLIDEYPYVFGGAAMLSSHKPPFVPQSGAEKIGDSEFAAISAAFVPYLLSALSDRRNGWLYFNRGSEPRPATCKTSSAD